MDASDNLPAWKSRLSELDHFDLHGSEVRSTTVERYTQSALATVRDGRRFTYLDGTTGVLRVGYFHRRSGRLTVLTDDEMLIINHFRCDGGAAYVRALRESTYGA